VAAHKVGTTYLRWMECEKIRVSVVVTLGDKIQREADMCVRGIGTSFQKCRRRTVRKLSI
jgi:hypothetical protein